MVTLDSLMKITGFASSHIISPNFSQVSLATAFSPRFVAGMAEAWRFSRRFNSQFSIIYSGERTVEKETVLSRALEHLDIPADTVMEWRSGDPVDAIIEGAEAIGTDLLVAGALIREFEVSGRIFLGGVARGLLKRGSCSLLLITRPSEKPRKYKRIVMVTDFSEGARNALRAALRVAEQDEAEHIHVIAIRSALAEARRDLEPGGKNRPTGEALLDEFATIASESSVKVEPRIIESATGVAAADFIKSVEANLLVIPTAHYPDGTLLPPRMDWVTQVIPCDLWVVKKARSPATQQKIERT
jgi:nucleotide-binding universal stress UspA family protein